MKVRRRKKILGTYKRWRYIVIRLMRDCVCAAVDSSPSSAGEFMKTRLVNKALEQVDPFDPNLSPETQADILHECKINPWYFFSECVKVPDQLWSPLKKKTLTQPAAELVVDKPVKIIDISSDEWVAKFRRIMNKGHFGARTPDYPLYNREPPINPSKE